MIKTNVIDRKRILKILIPLPFVLEIVALYFLPPEIPIHYNSNYQVDGYGSKYCVLILGILVIIFGLFMNWIYTRNIGVEYETIIYRLCVLALLVFNLINVWFLYTSMMFGVSYSIIGGADGPTAIFIAGSGRDIFPLVLLATVAVLAVIGIVKSRKNVKEK